SSGQRDPHPTGHHRAHRRAGPEGSRSPACVHPNRPDVPLRPGCWRSEPLVHLTVHIVRCRFTPPWLTPVIQRRYTCCNPKISSNLSLAVLVSRVPPHWPTTLEGRVHRWCSFM